MGSSDGPIKIERNLRDQNWILIAYITVLIVYALDWSSKRRGRKNIVYVRHNCFRSFCLISKLLMTEKVEPCLPPESRPFEPSKLRFPELFHPLSVLPVDRLVSVAMNRASASGKGQEGLLRNYDSRCRRPFAEFLQFAAGQSASMRTFTCCLGGSLTVSTPTFFRRFSRIDCCASSTTTRFVRLSSVTFH